MIPAALKSACHHFAQEAAPFLHIKDAQHYQNALDLIESLLEEAEDNPSDPLNIAIDLISRAIETYEKNEPALAAFEQQATAEPADLATLRLLIDQHKLSYSDLPEIGSKSMVSRVLSGERSLNKDHIKALAKRFRISPSMFF